MSEQRPLLPLTPTERRIAEMAFANGNEGEWGAIIAVARLRGERLGYSEAEEDAACKAMLAELRREPGSYPGWHEIAVKVGGVADREKARADRYRALLEALVACDNVSASVKAIQAVIASARKELGR